MTHSHRNLLNHYGIERDSRFVQAGKEARMIVGLFAANTFWVFGFAIWGSLTDQSAYPYVLGMPLWMTFALVGGIIGYPVVGIILALRLRECSLDDIDTSIESTK